MKKILFISSANLTVNPRIKKELLSAVSEQYEVHFVGFELGNWSSEIDKTENKNYNANFTYLSAQRKPLLLWFFSSLIEKICKIIYPFFKNNLKINAFGHSKRCFILNKYLKRNKLKFDLVVAHTLPTLYPAYQLSKKLKIPFTFDIEDFHPGENEYKDIENQKERKKFLMKNILPKTSLITYASPLIGKYSIDLITGNSPKHFLVNNCFSQKEFQFKENYSEKIKFVWFSQNISHGRGLELIIPELYKFKDKIELTLIGNLYSEFFNTFLKNYQEILKFEKPLPQKDLNLKLANYDIGLAIELETADLNRNICLTNKIFAYTQAGLYILATDTQAQKLFMKENSDFGLICEQKSEDVENKVLQILTNIEDIRNYKKTRFDYAKKLSWENESKKLVEVWKKIINKN